MYLVNWVAKWLLRIITKSASQTIRAWSTGRHLTTPTTPICTHEANCVFWSLFIIHTRVNVSLSPFIALTLCPPVLTFPYRILLCFLVVLLFLLLTQKLTFRDKSPMLHLFFWSSSSCRRKDRVEVTSLSEHWSQMAAFAGNACGNRNPLPTCSSFMTPRNSAIIPTRDGTAFLGIDKRLAPAAPAGAASSVRGAMGAAFSSFFVVAKNPPSFFWACFWRFQSGLRDDRIHRHHCQMHITPTMHMDIQQHAPSLTSTCARVQEAPAWTRMCTRTINACAQLPCICFGCSSSFARVQGGGTGFLWPKVVVVGVADDDRVAQSSRKPSQVYASLISPSHFFQLPLVVDLLWFWLIPVCFNN